MDQLKRLYASLTVKQRITLAVVAIGVIAGLFYLSRWNKERDFKPVYTNLAPEDAGQVLTKVRESGAEYRLAENGSTILVPSSKVAELRLSLAAAGLPKSGRIGFEIFDRTNFGASDFAEQINYHRALEGELERSIMSLTEVERARVHITFPKDSLYTESRQAAKASVLVSLRTGAKLSPQNVLAICHLTASAVDSLQPETVSVLDMRGNLLNRPRKAGLPDLPEPSEATLEYRQRLERELLSKINNTLEPLVGAEKFRSGVSVDCDFSSGEQSEESFDPAKSVMVTSQRSEDGSSTASASGVPGTASNLPRPTSRPASGSGGNSRRTENITYASSRTVRHLKLPQGNVRRISVSVLLDNQLRFEQGKRILEPPSPERIKIVKDVVAAAAGLQTERGDQLVVESSPFESTLMAEPPQGAAPSAPAPTTTSGPEWLRKLTSDKKFPIIVGVGGAALLALIGGAVFLALKSRKKKALKVAVQKTLEGPAGQEALPAGPDVEKQLQEEIAHQEQIKEKQRQDILGSIKLPAVTTKKTEVLVGQIQAEAKKDSASLALVVRSWLNNSD